MMTKSYNYDLKKKKITKYDISHNYEKQVEIFSQNYGILCHNYKIIIH